MDQCKKWSLIRKAYSYNQPFNFEWSLLFWNQPGFCCQFVRLKQGKQREPCPPKPNPTRGDQLSWPCSRCSASRCWESWAWASWRTARFRWREKFSPWKISIGYIPIFCLVHLFGSRIENNRETKNDRTYICWCVFSEKEGWSVEE